MQTPMTIAIVLTLITLMLLITNHPESDDNDDDHLPLRPLVALCDSAGPGTAFMSVSFVSLLSGEQVSKVAI